MSFLLPQLPPNFEAALRDVRAKGQAARIAAAHRLGDPEAAREDDARAGLVTLLADPQLQVRAAALESLEQVGDLSTWNAVRARVDDPSPLVQELAVLALAGVDHPQRARLLTQLGQPGETRPPAVRFQALAALAQHHPEPALEVLQAALSDPDGRVRARAARLLARYLTPDEPGTGPAAGNPDGPDAHTPLAQLQPALLAQLQPALQARLEDASAEVRLEAALSLAPLADPRAVPTLRAALDVSAQRLDALEALGAYPAEQAGSAVDEVFAWGTRVLAPPYLNALAGRCLLRMGRADLAAPCLREALTAWRPSGRNLALDAIAESATSDRAALADLGTLLLRLARHPRGSDPKSLTRAADALSTASESARQAHALIA